MEISRLRLKVEADWEATALSPGPPEWWDDFIEALNRGEARAAEPGEQGWRVNAWVKQGILLGFRTGALRDYSIPGGFPFFDKDTYPLRPVSLEDRVRIVPGGTSIRTGCHLAPGVVIMPPAYVNVGAFIDEGTMIDSHALVGSCAQVGKRVHVSAGAQIGGVLEPVGASPVIIEDEVMVGGLSGVFEGVQVGRRAVIAAGTLLTASVPVFDLVRERVLRSDENGPLRIPDGAVVVPGGRRLEKSEFARLHGLSLSCALIVKYRDEKTDARTALESSLR